MELTNGSDLILVLKLEDKKGESLRVKDCVTFKVRVWTTSRADCLVFYKTQINQTGEVDKIPISSSELNKLQSGVICYDYDYSVYDDNFEDDMKYDKVKEVVTDFYWRNTRIEGGNVEVTYDDLTRVYDKLSAEEDARMAEDYKLAEAINWLNLNACLKGSCSVIKDKEGNIIREFVVAEDVDPTYTKDEIDALVSELEGNIEQEIEETLNQSKEYTDSRLINYYTKPQINNLLKDLDEKIPTAVSQLDNDMGFLTRHQSLALYAKTADVQNWLSEYLKANEIEELYQPKGDYATSASVRYQIEKLINMAPEALDTLGEIAEKLKSNDDLHSALIDMLRKKANADMVYTKSEIDSKIYDSLRDYYRKEEIDSKLANVGGGSGSTDGNVDLSNYYTKSQSDERYVLAENAITEEDLQEWIEGNGAIFDLSDYLTKDEAEQKYVTKEESVKIWSGTQNEYDSLGTYNDNTVYIITV